MIRLAGTIVWAACGEFMLPGTVVAVSGWTSWLRRTLETIDYGWENLAVPFGTALVLIAVTLVPFLLLRVLVRELTRQRPTSPGQRDVVVCSCGRLVSANLEMCPACGRKVSSAC